MLFVLLGWLLVSIAPEAAVAAPEPGLVSEWQGNGNANDSVGTNNGTMVDGTYAPSQTGQQAFNLDGQNDYVTIPSTAMANVTGAISVSAWVKPSAAFGSVLSQYDSHDASTAFGLAIQGGGYVDMEVVGPGCDNLRGDAREAESLSTIPIGQWTQIAGTFNPSTQQLDVLINGQVVPTQLIASATVPSLCSSGTPLRIGAFENVYGALAGFFSGEIQDVKLYNQDITLPPASLVTTGPLLSNTVCDRTPSPAPVGPVQCTRKVSAGGASYPSGQDARANFSGTIVPGSDPIVSYWFHYVGSSGKYDTPHQPFSGSGSTQVSATDVGGIVPYRPWIYQLMAQDSAGNVLAGQAVPFDPGGLLNPDGFNPSGGYDISIQCATPCQALTPKGSSERTGIAFGTFGIAGPAAGFGGFGKITVASAQGGFGLFGATGTLNTVEFGLKGSVQLESFIATTTPLFSSDWSPLTFYGLVNNYNGPNQHPDGSVYYQPIMAGTLLGGGVWQACYQGGPCAPPEDGNKKLAGSLGFVSGGLAVGTAPILPLSVSLGLFSVITTAIAYDPADHHIHKKAQPLKVRDTAVPVGAGLTGQQAGALTKVVNALNGASAVGQAFLDSIQRYQGALAAGNIQAVIQQLKSVLTYGHELAARTRTAARVLSKQRRVIAQTRLARTRVSARSWARDLRSLRRHGLPLQLRRKLMKLGVSAAVIRDFNKRLPATSPTGARTALGPLLSASFAAQLRSFANGVDAYVTSLKTHPLA